MKKMSRILAVILVVTLIFANTSFVKAAENGSGDAYDVEENDVTNEDYELEEVNVSFPVLMSSSLNSVSNISVAIDYSMLDNLTVGTTMVFTGMYGNSVVFSSVVPENADAFTGEIRWAIRALDGTDNILVGNSSVFSDGYYYYLDVTLTAKDGYDFSSNVSCTGQAKIDVSKDINTIITDATANSITVEIYMGTAAQLAANIAKAKGSAGTPNPDPAPTPSETYYTITFNCNGAVESYSQLSVKAGETVNIDSYNPTRPDYTFDGWWTESTGGTQFTSNTVVNQSYELFAHWKAGETPTPPPTETYYTISFNCNGAVESYNQVTVKAGGTVNIDSYNPTRPDYTFDGWWTESTGGIQFTSNTVVNMNYELYAHWKAVENPTPTPEQVTYYWVKLNVNGGQQDYDDIQVEAGKTIDIDSYRPTRDGYTFDGWWTAKTGGTKFNNSIAVNQDYELFAHWEKGETDQTPTPEFYDVPKTQLLTATVVSNNAVQLSWNEVPGAAGYNVYRGKKLVTFTCSAGGNSMAWTDTNLKPGKVYKYRVLTLKYDENGVMISTKKYSPWIYVAVGGTTTKKRVIYSNAASLSLDETEFTIKKGKSKTINVKNVSPSYEGTQVLSNGYAKKVRFISDDKKIATVNNKGKVTGKKKGTTMVWAYTPNGIMVGVEITVK